MEINFRFIMNVIKMFFRGKGKAIADWFWMSNDLLIAILILLTAVVCIYLAGWIFILIGYYFIILVDIFGIEIITERYLVYFFVGILYTAGLVLLTCTSIGLVLVTKWVKRNLTTAIRDAMELENKQNNS